MSSLLQLLEVAEEHLFSAKSAKREKRRTSIVSFLEALKRCAQEVEKGAASWNEARPWAVRHGQAMIDAFTAIEEWSARMGPTGGSDEECEAALERRSKLQLAMDLFRDTAAEPWLMRLESEEIDQDYHDRAVDHDLVAPDWVPRSHTWWLWKDS